MRFGLVDVVLFPLQLELIFLMVRLICSSKMWFGKLLLMRVCLTFLISEKIFWGRGEDLSWARFIRFLIVAILYSISTICLLIFKRFQV